VAKNEVSPPVADGFGQIQSDGSIQVELIRASPRRFESVVLKLPAGTTVAEALEFAGVSLATSTEQAPTDDEEVAVAVFGERVDPGYMLSMGDRIELLRPLLADPKEARRKRAKTKASRP
jgi:uncharacterized protein